MRRAAASIVCGLLIACLGCTQVGLSSREQPGQDFSTYIHSLYDQPAAPAAGETTLRQADFPVRLAVAQIGEVAPPETLMQRLQRQHGLFERVEPLPGDGMPAVAPVYLSHRLSPDESQRLQREHLERSREALHAHTTRMRQMARDMGMTHLVILGGRIDMAHEQNGLALADLTIVGAFVVPSREIIGSGRASAAMIDLATGRTVLIASAQQDATRWSSAIGREADQVKLLRRMRDDLAGELAADLVRQCARRAGMELDRKGNVLARAGESQPVQ